MQTTSPQYSLRDLVVYFLKLGSTGFGGPVALVSYMHRDLVEKRRWMSEEEYKEGIALAQLSPGPLALQLAIYLGYVHYRIVGATLAGLSFVLPSFLIVLLLGYFYKAYGGLTWIEAVFYGVSSGVIGIIAVHSYRLTKKNVGNEWLQWIIFGILAISTFLLKGENTVLILGAGFLYCLYKTRFSFKLPIISLSPVLVSAPASISFSSTLGQIALIFTKAGALVFGGGLAILPFLYGDVVQKYHWLTDQQFIDAVAVAMITPGPILITVGFIGYLIAGFSGACVAACATFLPCYLCTIIPAPYVKKYAQNHTVQALVDGLTAAAIGALAGSVLLIALRQFEDWGTILFAVMTAAVLIVSKRITEPVLIIICAIIGYVIKTTG